MRPIGQMPVPNPAALEFQAFQQRLRDQANHGHDRPPEPGGVERVLTAADGSVDIPGDAFGRGHEGRVRANQAVRHRRIHKAGFDRQHVNARREEPIAQTLQIGCQPGLGSPVGVVALPAPIAGDRRNGGQVAFMPVLASSSRPGSTAIRPT